MQLVYTVNDKAKQVTLRKDKVNGKRFTVFTALELFSYEEKGYKINCIGKDATRKFNNFRVACWRLK